MARLAVSYMLYSCPSGTAQGVTRADYGGRNAFRLFQVWLASLNGQIFRGILPRQKNTWELQAILISATWGTLSCRLRRIPRYFLPYCTLDLLTNVACITTGGQRGSFSGVYVTSVMHISPKTKI
jgi:hypothetical protein